MSEFSEYMRLLPYGYAPGNYMNKCFACEKVVADVDKRATSCRPCAEAAFKDHEIERLRAEVAGLREQVQHLQSLLVDADNICKEHGGCDLQDCIDNDGDLYQSQAMADALDAARKGTTPTRLPPSLSPRS